MIILDCSDSSQDLGSSELRKDIYITVHIIRIGMHILISADKEGKLLIIHQLLLRSHIHYIKCITCQSHILFRADIN